MMTKILKINRRRPEVPKIRIAAEVLRKGGLVAFPTETVYGLGADALNAAAVRKIFEVKGRPFDNPLIVHIADRKEVCRLAKEIPDNARELMNEFWPGPLTLVLKKSEVVPDVTTGGLDTVAVRMPDNKIALAMIKEAGVAVAAPSANIFSKPSPTSAAHVAHDLYGKVDVIIDGGVARIGVESTVVDLTTTPPTLLRPGGISLEDLKKVLGRVVLHPVVRVEKTGITAKSPGMKYRHYAPDASVIVVEGRRRKVGRKMRQLVEEYKRKGKIVGVMATNRRCGYTADVVKFAGNDPAAVAKNLFKVFRKFDEEGVDVILAEGVGEKGLGLAIMNRLKKAAYKVVKA